MKWALESATERALLLDLARHIVESKAGHFEPTKFDDHYEAALQELLEKKQTAALLRGRAPTERACLHPSSHRPIVPHFCGIQYRTVRLLSLVIIAYPIRVRGTDGVGN